MFDSYNLQAYNTESVDFTQATASCSINLNVTCLIEHKQEQCVSDYSLYAILKICTPPHMHVYTVMRVLTHTHMHTHTQINTETPTKTQRHMRTLSYNQSQQADT